MLNRFGNIVKNLTVFPENMIRNMNSTFGLIFSQRAMLTLIEKGMTREQAYDLVQPKTAQSWDNQVDFKPLLESDPEVTSRLTQEEIDEIFNPVYYTKRVDEIFERIGLGDYGYLYKQANDIIRKDLENFLNIIADKAKEHKFTIMMGRTHGVHAEPTTFGLKLATWYSEMKRNIERFEHAAAGVEAGKISGAVGNFANIPPFVEKYVCDKLVSVLKKSLHRSFLVTFTLSTFAVLASIATSIERMATEIRGLQKSEQREVEEFFAKGQKVFSNASQT